MTAQGSASDRHTHLAPRQQRDPHTQHWLPVHDEASALDIKTRVAQELALGKSLKKACEAAGTYEMTVWRFRKTDPEWDAFLEDWRRGVGFRSLSLIEEAAMHPEEYEAGLKYGNWGNFLMFTSKATFPDMRDNAQINVSIDNRRVELGDWQTAIQAYEASREPTS